MMNTRPVVSAFLLLVIGTACVMPALAGESGLADNAALQYWKAFALLPELSDEQDDAMHKALEQGTIDESVREVIASSGSALRELSKGAKLKACCWGISFEEEGIDTVMPHLSKAREVSRLACLRAEASFQQGKGSDATDDIAAVMSLARHTATDGVLIALLVDYALESMAIRTAAANLPSLDAEQLEALAQKLETLPPQPTLSQAIMAEKEAFLGSVIRILSQPGGKQRIVGLFGGPQSDDAKQILKYSQEELLAAAKQLRGFYDRLAEAVMLSPDEAKQAEKRLMADPGIEGPMREAARALTPAVGASRMAEATQQTRMALLKAAIAVRQHGPDVLKKDAHRDPFGTGPLKYAKTDSGFTLQAALIDRKGQAVTLRVGRP